RSRTDKNTEIGQSGRFLRFIAIATGSLHDVSSLLHQRYSFDKYRAYWTSVLTDGLILPSVNWVLSFLDGLEFTSSSHTRPLLSTARSTPSSPKCASIVLSTALAISSADLRSETIAALFRPAAMSERAIASFI